MIIDQLGAAVLITAIVIYGIAMISLCIYALSLSKKISEERELQKSLRLRHILDYHVPEPLLGVVTPKNSKKKGPHDA